MKDIKETNYNLGKRKLNTKDHIKLATEEAKKREPEPNAREARLAKRNELKEAKKTRIVNWA